MLTILALEVRGFLVQRHSLKLEGIRLADSTPHRINLPKGGIT